MSKKMKRVDGGAPPLPPYGGGGGGGAKIRLKYQALLQDYEDLQKDTDDMRNKLDAAKQRKLRLLAEVRFLRRRYKYLLKLKSFNRLQEPLMNLEKQHNLNPKDRILQKRETGLFKLPPLPKPKPKGKFHSRKEVVMRNMVPTLALNRRQTLDGGKEATLRISTPVSELNLRKRIGSGRATAVPNSEPSFNLNQIQQMQVANDANLARRTPLFDLNQDTNLISGTSVGGKEATLHSRAPTFDLNEISTEEELLNSCESLKFEDPKIGLIRGGNEEQSNDLKLSICRNAGEEGSSRIGKRKISWQDPVALRV